MTEEARFLNKKSGGPNLDSMGLNYVQNEVFLEFGSLVFLEILYNDTMSLTYSRGKTYEKIFGTQIWAKRAKVGAEIRFFSIFSILVP